MQIPTARSLRTDLRPQTTPPQRRAYDAATSEDEGTVNYSEEQKEIWNSSEMVAARAAVEEFCRHSAQTSLAEGQKFLSQLSQLSPEGMQNWLERYQARRTNDLLGREVEHLARQLMVERSLSQREARRQATARIAELRSQATAAREDQYPTPQQLAAARRMRHLGVVTIGVFPGFDPLEAVVDPASPRGYCRKVAAAMSLPGDLPRDDPRNFIRGEEGIDLGEWATSRDAQPPAQQVAPASAAPANDAPAGE
ncbi:DUF2076 domain-containing protein [Bythopirellula polymerisocia]|uniref:DUF2076 domain-containing protein n=1 Tax=Bythopirellula polymerisocia TaxID=2528003 RepID=UPI0011B746D8|nr:DUF2076 domain-containing protein [Bythopirellula polymerisocia]